MAAPNPRLEVLPAPGAARPLRVLEGHSGARVTLCQDGARSFVRKASAAPGGNARLARQAEKQRGLVAWGVPMPRIFAQGEDEAGCLYFDMDYVPARTLGASVAQAAAIDPGALVGALERMMWLFKSHAGPEVPATLFHAKLGEIMRACADVPQADETGRRLARFNWSGIPASPAHGDLTFENILIGAGDRIAFIDCDDPWVSSFWLDVAKLYQDARGHWCLRALYAGGGARVALLNAVQKIERLLPALDAFAGALDPRMKTRLTQMAALHLFRTLPYARTRETQRFALERIDLLLRQER